MAVTIEYRKDGFWHVSTLCKTKPEAFAKAARIEEVNPEAFKPVPIHHAVDAPLPPPILEVIAQREADSPEDMGLKAGEALNPVSQADEE